MSLASVFRPLRLLYQPARAFEAVAARRADRRNARKLRGFRDLHRGGRCFVVGNGPSLSTADLERLAGEVSFATNKIYLLFDQTGWRPSYYVAEDDHFIAQHQDLIRGWRGAEKFLNGRWRHLFPHDDDLVWYPWCVPPETGFPQFSLDAEQVVYCGYMVTYICLQLAFYMGFSRVYLLGVDFDYSLTFEGKATVAHATDHPSDHFTPHYFRPGELRYLPRLDRAETAMRCAREVYAAHGRQILNATRAGKLEVFPRVTLENALRD